jgi:hypothetical protein
MVARFEATAQRTSIKTLGEKDRELMQILRTWPDTVQSAADRGHPATFRKGETYW